MLWIMNFKNGVLTALFKNYKDVKDAKVDSKGDWVTKAQKNHINCSEMLLK